MLLARLDRRARRPVREAAEDGARARLGGTRLHDHGLLHSRLCNDLYEDGLLELGVETDERGLSPGREAAVRGAVRANARGDTEPVTWFRGSPPLRTPKGPC
ncbi:hypothetical protein [Kitasatospora paracochleata]|uniref:Uncharacterized protein n=1 Tax=Kitasatospora paracochleata TaxID=58354 RepID=A0ABT1JBI9_9ACTN|nr:hypothetical protein [Kitasatospora paracochleata]MCP2314599.1 hypothetical protein [Kitasatospora paracochleata]